MKKVHFGFCILLLMMGKITYAQQAVVNANIKGLGEDTLFVEWNPFSKKNNFEDTLLAKENKFNYTIKVDKPTLIFIKLKKALAFVTPASKFYIPQSKRISIVLLPGDTSFIEGTLKKYALEYSVKGAKVNQELALHHKQELDKRIQYFITESRIDSLFKIGETQAMKPLMGELAAFKAGFRESAETYVQKNPGKDYAVLLLVSSNNPEFFGSYINTLDDRVKNGVFKELLQERINLYNSTLNAKSVIVGTKAPGFTSTDINGKSFKLSAFPGKYVLLDFWGSWCVPCIQGFPAMKEYYEKYKTKVDFVGIACNDKAEAWKTAVLKNDLKWTQLLNKEELDNSLSGIYGVHKFPTKILIDPSGNIVLKFTGEGSAFYQQFDEIMNVLK